MCTDLSQVLWAWVHGTCLSVSGCRRVSLLADTEGRDCQVDQSAHRCTHLCNRYGSVMPSNCLLHLQLYFSLFVSLSSRYNNKIIITRQFVRRRNMSVDTTRAPKERSTGSICSKPLSSLWSTAILCSSCIRMRTIWIAVRADVLQPFTLSTVGKWAFLFPAPTSGTVFRHTWHLHRRSWYSDSVLRHFSFICHIQLPDLIFWFAPCFIVDLEIILLFRPH